MFASEKKVKKGFSLTKRAMDSLKDSMNSWVIFLNGNQRELKMKVQELERRLEKMEAKAERREIEVLRSF